MLKNKSLTYIDLFAGAGGLSEGFIRSGYKPIAHIEIDTAACNTLKTRVAYHWLKRNRKINKYYDYLFGEISRATLYNLIPKKQIDSVINDEIGKDKLKSIFKKIDSLLEGNKPDLIIGGPPCQAYSLVGRSRDKNRMNGDNRNYLYVYYAKFLNRYKPKYFIFENVTGLLSAKSDDGISYFDSMRKLFNKAGYETEFQVLSADEYGVLQKRKRIFIVGKRGKKIDNFPEPQKWNPYVTVSEILSDLPSLNAGQGSINPCKLKNYKGKYLYDARIRDDNSPVTFHSARPHSRQDLQIYRIAVNKWQTEKARLNYNDLPKRLRTHKNRLSFLDRFKVVASDLPNSQTVVAHISKDGHYYIHPDTKQNRSITPREAARLQSFPDDYYFEGVSDTPGRTAAFHQIGNAVPVLLAEKIAEKLKEIW